jgi:hypothetical protein
MSANLEQQKKITGFGIGSAIHPEAKFPLSPAPRRKARPPNTRIVAELEVSTLPGKILARLLSKKESSSELIFNTGKSGVGETAGYIEIRTGERRRLAVKWEPTTAIDQAWPTLLPTAQERWPGDVTLDVGGEALYPRSSAG